ncbi:holo-ACP synthase [Rosettibacter firmus]|uniref:holo-ACP synthase n=1 Tax=Rosettibacter firmus TaxID=3111522 RepID=UPI00336BB326
MILGIGIDIIEIERIKKSVEQYGDNFLNRIFTKTELEYSLNKKNKFQHLAARFAAKEAITKAISSHHKSFGWKDIEIVNLVNGMPTVNLLGKLKDFLGNDKIIHISMSHSDHYVTCVAILSLKT